MAIISPGTPVAFVASEATEASPATIYPALVQRVHDDGSTVTACVQGVDGEFFLATVPFDEAARKDTWHFPQSKHLVSLEAEPLSADIAEGGLVRDGEDLVTATTNEPHGFSTGDVVTVGAAGDQFPAAEGVTITVTGDDTFTYSDDQGAEGASESATTATRDVATDYELGQEYALLVDATAAAQPVLLPPAAEHPGRTILIKKVDDAGAFSVGVSAADGDTIEGVTSITLTAEWDYLRLTSDGDETWLIEGSKVTVE